MPTGLKSNEKLATFNCPRDRWEQFKQQVGKGNAAKTLNAMISAYLEGAIDVNNWTTTEPINGSEWSRELESQVESKLKTAIANLTTELMAKQELRLAEIAEQASQKCKDAVNEVGDLKLKVDFVIPKIAAIKKELDKNKWMVEKYADVLIDIEELQGEVDDLKETTKEYMKGF